MKRVVLLLGMVVMLASCTKLLDQITTFSFTREASFTIPATATLGIPIVLNTPDVVTNHESEFENNNTSVDKVEYVKLTAMNLQITSPASGNFNFLKSIELTIRADGLADKIIASKNNIANDNVNALDIDVPGEDLKPYLTKDKFIMKVEVVTDEGTTQDYDIKTSSTFEVKAKIQ